MSIGPSATDVDHRRTVQWRFGVLGVSLLAVLVTLVNIAHVSMWTDEAATISMATRSLRDISRMAQNLDAVHAVYNLLLHAWLSWFGASAISVRLPSAIAVGAAAAGTMVLTSRLVGRRSALAAGLVFAVLPRVTWMGIEGRSYALTAAVAVWWSVLFLSLVRRPTWGRHVGYALLGAFAGSLNIFVILVLGAHGLTLLLDRRLRSTRLIWSWSAAALGAVLGAAPVLLTSISQSGQIGPARLGIIGYLRTVAVNQWFLGDTPTLFRPSGDLVDAGQGLAAWKIASVLLAAVCWLVIGYATVRRRGEVGPPPDYRPLLLGWLAIPTLVVVGYAVVASPIYNPRYLTFAVPAVAALLGIGLVDLARPSGRRRWLGFAAAGLIVALSIPVFISQRTIYAKSGADWKEVAAFVAARRGSDQGVYFAPRIPSPEPTTGITTRTAAVLYPTAFSGVRDLTLLSTAAAEANLTGRSQPLTAAGARLTGVTSVFVIRGRNYPSSALAADTAFLTALGFRPGDSWQGPLNSVTLYVR